MTSKEILNKDFLKQIFNHTTAIRSEVSLCCRASMYPEAVEEELDKIENILKKYLDESI